MAVNKNALIRYKTIDKCLQNRFRKWTLDNLIDACSDALYEYEGKDTYVSKRTVQLDLQNMRSDKLGYNAPIIVIDRKYYTYEDKNYSITNLPISSSDLEKLAESILFLKQFKGFSHFESLNGVVQKLEDYVYSSQTQSKPVIEFEKNENLKGLGFLDELYQSIIKKMAIQITYKSFKARQESTFNFHPYLLKEFRNRWFVIGVRKNEKNLVNLALDRIISLNKATVSYKENTTYDLEKHFDKAIGVSINPYDDTEEIRLFVYHKHAPYILTKPFHHSQQLLSRDLFGITIKLDVQHNFELEKDILGLGEGIRVLAPSRLKRRIKERLIYASESYETEISKKSLANLNLKMTHKGTAILNQVYSLRNIKKIKQEIYRYTRDLPTKPKEITVLLDKIPLLKKIIFNNNLEQILAISYPNAELETSIYYKKVSKEVLAKGWFQDYNKDTLNVIIYLKDSNINTFWLKLILASHKQHLSVAQRKIIIENSNAFDSSVYAGGVQLINPNLLQKWEQKHTNTVCDVILLRFKINDY